MNPGSPEKKDDFFLAALVGMGGRFNAGSVFCRVVPSSAAAWSRAPKVFPGGGGSVGSCAGG
eukprot:2212685-Pyramimonas_sp.AAC.1